MLLFFPILSYYLPPPSDPQGPGAFPPNLSLGVCDGPPAKLTLPSDPYFHCKIKFVIIFLKYKIQKLNLLSKTDISETA